MTHLSASCKQALCNTSHLKRFHYLIKSLMRNPYYHTFSYFWDQAIHILSSRVINMNKERKGIVEELLSAALRFASKSPWFEHPSSLSPHSYQNIFSQVSFAFFAHCLLLMSNFTLMLLKHVLMTPLWHKASNAHRECKHLTANLAF